MIEFQKSDIAIFASVTALAISILALVISLSPPKQIKSDISGEINTSTLQKVPVPAPVPPAVPTALLNQPSGKRSAQQNLSLDEITNPPKLEHNKTKVLEKKENNSPNSLNVTSSKLGDARQKLKRVPTKKVSQILNFGRHGITNSTLNNVKLKKVVVKSFTRNNSLLDPNSLEGIMAIRRKKLEGEDSNLSEQNYVSPIKKGKKPCELSGLAQQVSGKVKVEVSNEDSREDSSAWSEGDSYFQTDDSPKNGTSVGLYVSNNVEAPKNKMDYTPKNNVFADIIDNNVEVVENNKIDDGENSNYDNISDEAKNLFKQK
ncbi:MAG: hypothetical protein IJG00_04515 [Clostridia bacterium]|nr:hypothetical protein [Clostridia bacterium]